MTRLAAKALNAGWRMGHVHRLSLCERVIFRQTPEGEKSEVDSAFEEGKVFLMATWNAKLQNLSEEEVIRISDEFLRGWQDLSRYGFRLQGFNHMREKYGMEPLTREQSDEYRLLYIRKKYSAAEIRAGIEQCLLNERVADSRWRGIELFDCRFGREYARLFKTLLGSRVYRELSEQLRVYKLRSTQNEKYGGVGLAGKQAAEKARETCLARYGTENPMQSSQVQQILFSHNIVKFGEASPFGRREVRDKARKMKSKNAADAIKHYKLTGELDEKIFHESPQEMTAFLLLCERFGTKDVYYQYGIHPSDPRYPYACDFYIKSLDLFIEMNGHYTHGGHWYNPEDKDDALRVKHLLASGKKSAANFIRTWTVTDIEKRQKAKSSGIRYLVFWDGSRSCTDGVKRPRLSDFMCWLYDYGADYDAFTQDHPENTY